jgi:hypothetical protein
MKINVMVIIAAMFLTLSVFSQQNANPQKEKSIKKIYPHVSLAPIGGAIFPLTKSLRDEFKPGGLVGLDIGYGLTKK